MKALTLIVFVLAISFTFWTSDVLLKSFDAQCIAEEAVTNKIKLAVLRYLGYPTPEPPWWRPLCALTKPDMAENVSFLQNFMIICAVIIFGRSNASRKAALGNEPSDLPYEVIPVGFPWKKAENARPSNKSRKRSKKEEKQDGNQNENHRATNGPAATAVNSGRPIRPAHDPTCPKAPTVSPPKAPAQRTGLAPSTEASSPKQPAQRTGQAPSTEASPPKQPAQGTGQAPSTEASPPKQPAQRTGRAPSTTEASPPKVTVQNQKTRPNTPESDHCERKPQHIDDYINLTPKACPILATYHCVLLGPTNNMFTALKHRLLKTFSSVGIPHSAVTWSSRAGHGGHTEYLRGESTFMLVEAELADGTGFDVTIHQVFTYKGLVCTDEGSTVMYGSGWQR